MVTRALSTQSRETGTVLDFTDPNGPCSGAITRERESARARVCVCVCGKIM